MWVHRELWGCVDRAWCYSVFSQVPWDAEAEIELLVLFFEVEIFRHGFHRESHDHI